MNTSQGLEGYDFNFLPELQLEARGLTNNAFESEPQAYLNRSAPYDTPEYKEEFQKVIEKVAMGREVETIKLFKPEKQSLGFSVIANPGDPAIYVQDIQPGGIADRYVNRYVFIIYGDGDIQQSFKCIQDSFWLVDFRLTGSEAITFPALQVVTAMDYVSKTIKTIVFNLNEMK